MKHTFTGRVVRVLPTEQKSSGFQTRKIHVGIDEDTKYPQVIEVELSGDRCDMGDRIQQSQVVKFECDIRGREWTDPKTNTVKVFNTISCWKIVNESEVQPQPQQSNDIPF
jgi:hypothetical protein